MGRLEAPVSSIDDVVTAAVLEQGLTVAPASGGLATTATLSPHVGAVPLPSTASTTVSPAGTAGRARVRRRTRSIPVAAARPRSTVGSEKLAPAAVAATAAAAVLHQAVKFRERTHRPPAEEHT